MCNTCMNSSFYVLFCVKSGQSETNDFSRNLEICTKIWVGDKKLFFAKKQAVKHYFGSLVPKSVFSTYFYSYLALKLTKMLIGAVKIT